MSNNYSFMEYARCKNNKSIDFFADNIIQTNQAIKFCKQCPVQGPCLQYAMEENITHGVFGATSARARNRIRKAIKIKAIKDKAFTI